MELEPEEKEFFKVFVVEDDEIDRLAFKKAVKDNSLPYQCTITSSVSEAEQILSTDSFDVAVVDYRLGDGTAFDVFMMLKDTPTIFTTGAGDEEVAIKAMKSGVYDYLVKDPSRNYLKVLPGVIKNAVVHKRNEEKIREYHSNLERLVKERTEQLEAEKELLAVTMSSMSDGVIALNVDKRIVLFNRVVEQLTGWTFSEVQGRGVDEVFKVVKEKTGEYVDVVNRVFDSGQVEFGTEQDCLITKNGSFHPVAVSAAAIRKNDGKIVGVVIVLRDVTREREIDRMKADFVSSVSHELRSPLTSIRACTETIQQEPNIDKQTSGDFLKIIDEESKRLAMLIDSLLEISRIESGKKELNLADVDIAEIAQKVSAAMRPLAEKKRVKLSCNIAGGAGSIVGDEDRIESIIANLVNNAIKFTPDGGSVDISVQQTEEEAQIIVSDTGIGIPRDSLSRIFDRFYRVYRPGSRIQGTGLGLAIVKEIVAMHGGRVTVESEEGRGSKFTVILPLIAHLQLNEQTVNQI